VSKSFLLHRLINIFSKEKKAKKKASSLAACLFKPKGNGINPWIDVADRLDAAGAGYGDEDLLCRFMP